MRKFYHLIPPPAPLSSIQKRQDRVKSQQQAPMAIAYANFLLGFLSIGLALALLPII